MAFVLADRVKETTTTQGNGSSYTLAGPETGFESFSVIGNGNKTYYCCTDGTDFEIGIGTYTASGTTLSRHVDDVLQSSNSDGLVNWGSGTKDIFVTQPAEKAVFLNADGVVELYYDNVKTFETTASGAKIHGNTGDAVLLLEADTTNTDEADNAYIEYSQDGGGVTAQTGLGVDGNNSYRIHTTTGSGTTYFDVYGGSNTKLFYGTSEKMQTTSGGVDVTGNITVSGTVDGRDLATDGTKLDGIEASADVTDTANVTAAGALMDSEVTNLAQVKAFDSADYATAAQGTTADAAMQDLVDDTTPQLGGVLDTNGNNINFGDNDKAQFGASNDLQVYHDGDNSFITEGGTGSLFIGGNSFVQLHKAGSTEKMLEANADGAVELYYNDAKKLETNANGVTVTGLLSATTKSFDIPHPTKENMRLRYGSLEGPENGVYVRGRLTGSSVIELPAHWAGLVDEDSITVQLTAIGKSQDLWVEEASLQEVKICSRNVDCFYTVMAERIDVAKLEVEYAN